MKVAAAAAYAAVVAPGAVRAGRADGVDERVWAKNGPADDSDDAERRLNWVASTATPACS
jgi:hypothetical protein